MSVKIWCPIHDYTPLRDAEASECSFCAAAARQKQADIRTLNAASSIGRCGFCGGPTPCLRD